MAGRSTFAAFVRAQDRRYIVADKGRMVKPRGVGTTPPGSRGGTVT